MHLQDKRTRAGDKEGLRSVFKINVIGQLFTSMLLLRLAQKNFATSRIIALWPQHCDNSLCDSGSGLSLLNQFSHMKKADARNTKFTRMQGSNACEWTL